MCICDVTRSRHFLFLKATLSLKDFPRAKKKQNKRKQETFEKRRHFTHTHKQNRSCLLKSPFFFVCVCFFRYLHFLNNNNKKAGFKKKTSFPFSFWIFEPGPLVVCQDGNQRYKLDTTWEMEGSPLRKKPLDQSTAKCFRLTWHRGIPFSLFYIPNWV